MKKLVFSVFNWDAQLGPTELARQGRARVSGTIFSTAIGIIYNIVYIFCYIHHLLLSKQFPCHKLPKKECVSECAGWIVFTHTGGLWPQCLLDTSNIEIVSKHQLQDVFGGLFWMWGFIEGKPCARQCSSMQPIVIHQWLAFGVCSSGDASWYRSRFKI